MPIISSHLLPPAVSGLIVPEQKIKTRTSHSKNVDLSTPLIDGPTTAAAAAASSSLTAADLLAIGSHSLILLASSGSLSSPMNVQLSSSPTS